MSYRPITDVWILARPKVKYFGAYPAGFLQRARDMLAVTADAQVLHICSGKVRDYKCGPSCSGNGHYHGLGKNDITADLDPALKPDLIFDARDRASYTAAISAHPQIQAALADPPYMKHFAAHYVPGADAFPSGDTIVNNTLRILPVGARMGILSMGWPRYPTSISRPIAIIGVVVGNGNIGRWFAVYERTK